MKKGLSLFYFFLGIVLQFPDLAVRIFLMRKGMEPAMLAVFTGTLVIPWCLKPLYGMISDNFPICAQRRKPYIVISNILCSFCWLLMKNIDRIWAAQVVLFCASIFTCVADVCYDSILVEVAKTENDQTHGKAQSWCWGARALGALIASFFGGFLLQNIEPGTIFLIQGFIFNVIALFSCFLIREDEYFPTRDTSCFLQCRDLCQAIKHPTLWKPALFVFLFAATPSSYSAFFYFLVNELKYSTSFLGLLTCVRHGAMLIGTALYSKWLRNINYRTFFCTLVLVSALMGATPIILVTHMNLQVGLPNSMFTLGDDLFLSVIGQIALMPCLVLAAKLCPKGIEASLYATFVSVLNLAGIVSEYTGAALTDIMGVTKDDFTYLPHLIAICTVTSLIPLCFLCLLPHGNVSSVMVAIPAPAPASAESPRI